MTQEDERLARKLLDLTNRGDRVRVQGGEVYVDGFRLAGAPVEVSNRVVRERRRREVPALDGLGLIKILIPRIYADRIDFYIGGSQPYKKAWSVPCDFTGYFVASDFISSSGGTSNLLPSPFFNLAFENLGTDPNDWAIAFAYWTRDFVPTSQSLEGVGNPILTIATRDNTTGQEQIYTQDDFPLPLTQGLRSSGYTIGLEVARNPLLLSVIENSPRALNGQGYSYSLSPGGVIHSNQRDLPTLNAGLQIVGQALDWPYYSDSNRNNYRNGFSAQLIDQSRIYFQTDSGSLQQIATLATNDISSVPIGNTFRRTWTTAGFVIGFSGGAINYSNVTTSGTTSIFITGFDLETYTVTGISNPIPAELKPMSAELAEDIFITQTQESGHYGQFFGNPNRVRSNDAGDQNSWAIVKAFV